VPGEGGPCENSARVPQSPPPDDCLPPAECGCCAAASRGCGGNNTPRENSIDILSTLPVWALALLIFLLRVIDVSMGTVRTLTVVSGKVRLSVILGFFEVLVWVVAISQVLAVAGRQPVLLLAYSAGFATGNAVGIWIERRLALGRRVLRIISMNRGDEIAAALRAGGQAVTTFRGEGRDGPRTLLYLLAERRQVSPVIAAARELDPDLFFVVEPVYESREMPLPRATGWRSPFKMK
jgi:uncharacterized protein YebE (UPF0316 family)